MQLIAQKPMSAEEVLVILEAHRDCKLIAVYKAVQNWENYIISNPHILLTDIGTQYMANINNIKKEIIKKYTTIRF